MIQQSLVQRMHMAADYIDWTVLNLLGVAVRATAFILCLPVGALCGDTCLHDLLLPDTAAAHSKPACVRQACGCKQVLADQQAACNYPTCPAALRVSLHLCQPLACKSGVAMLATVQNFLQHKQAGSWSKHMQLVLAQTQSHASSISLAGLSQVQQHEVAA